MFGETSPVNGLLSHQSQEDIPAAITDVGCERELNEDRYAVIDSPAGRAWVVCDGMGGAMGGELAAQLAIDAIRRGLETINYDTSLEALKGAVEEANRIIVLRRQNPAFSSMGTTVVATLIKGDEVTIANAGDSRAYLIRDRAIQQLSVDHTYVQDLVDRGALNAEEALSHPQAHVLTRCLGAEPRLSLELQSYWIWNVTSNEPQDKLLLCSDGLYSLVSDEEIADIISSFSPQESCVQLVELAKARGGYDNITLAILPLGGQLREENPGGQARAAAPKKTRDIRTAKKKQPPRFRFSTKTRMILYGLLMVLGMVVVTLVVLLKLAKH